MRGINPTSQTCEPYGFVTTHPGPDRSTSIAKGKAYLWPGVKLFKHSSYE
jgi:hypothetical protein